MGSDVVSYLRRFIGTPYIFGGNNPMQGFDCSGLVCEGLKFAGVIKNHEDWSSHGLYMKFRETPEETFPFRPGALVFFGTKLKVIHIAMVTDGFHMIEAGGGTENTRSLEIAIQRNAFVRERPILSRTDLVGCHMPPYPVISRSP